MSHENLSFKIARIHKLSTNSRVKAFVDMKINDVLVIRGLKVISGPDGLFVSMPQEQGKDKKWYDTIRCLSQDIRNEISECILSAYQKENA